MISELLGRVYLALLFAVLLSGGSGLCGQGMTPVVTPYPILFVTQVPIPADFTTIGSTFGNHQASVGSVGRGGDLWIRYTDGSLRNLTAAAGFGNAGFQGAQSIAVRDPSVHWSGQKALFSMVVGATTQQYVWQSHVFQIYEITGLGQTETPQITLIPNQPTNYSNISPIYGSDDQIIFTSDRPRDGSAHLHPQRDEYEEAPVVSGLWKLNPTTGDLSLLSHAPSGIYTPVIDSFGRVIFTQWDHLQRDQQADAHATATPPIPPSVGTFNWSDESASALPLNDRSELFPEPRNSRIDLLAGTNLNGHNFNHFFPWMCNQDGSEQETLNHIGRHELHDYFNTAIHGDPNLVEFISAVSGRFNPRSIHNFFHIEEDPTLPGRYYGIDALEFRTHSAGQIVSMTVPPGQNPDSVSVDYLTHPDTRTTSAIPGPNHSGHYRDPLPLSNGLLIAAHTAETDVSANLGTRALPIPRYDFRLKLVVSGTSGYASAGQALTPGITKTVIYWDPDVSVTYSGNLWELDPVEVRPRNVPPLSAEPLVLDTPEQIAFDSAGVDAAHLRQFLKSNNLALIVSRDVTTRDGHDVQQPFNLRVTGTGTQTLGAGGTIYDVSHLQFFQGDLIRGIGGTASPAAGRRVLAQPLHDGIANNPPNLGGPAGSVAVGSDGSMAAFVPARRALSWQLTDGVGTPVVRERYWLNFQPGEIRVCTSCHGINTTDQSGALEPGNTPLALTELLSYWQAQTGPVLSSPAAAGSVGAGLGAPVDVLFANGSMGGAGRRVDFDLGQSITLTLGVPIGGSAGARLALWGMVGVPSVGTPTQLGPFAIPLQPSFPSDPLLFTLVNGLWADPSASLSGGTTPFSFSLPAGFSSPALFTIQGLMDDPGNSPFPFGITNALILRVN